MPRKKNTLRFTLTENDNVVRAILAVDGTQILDFENEEAPPITVRHPKARERELLEHATYWSRRNPEMGDISAWLRRYVGSREKDLVKQILDIRKTMRKIAGTVRNARIAKKLMKDLQK